MKRSVTYRVFVCIAFAAMAVRGLAQSVPVSATCNGATGICTGSSYSFPASINSGTAQVGANYGCLKTQPNPAWFFMRIKSSGSISIRMSSAPARDIDFVLWGPFASATAPCVAGLDTTKIIDCSYSTSSVERADIPNAVAGAYYIMLITNYSNRNTDITFAQTGGTGASDCDVLCNVTDLTAVASACDTAAAKGTYTLRGVVTVFSPPSTGTLTVASSCGKSITYNAPFSNTINYAIPGITGKGDSCAVTAFFSAVGTCTRTAIYAAPSCCALTAATPLSSCAGQSLQLQASGTTGGVFHWSGPGSFLSTLANPLIANVTPAHAGNYQVFLTNGSCTTVVKTAVVSIKPAPDTSLVMVGSRSFCEGDSLVIKAAPDSGLTYQWQWNNANIPSAVSKQYSVKNSGNYRVYITGVNGCSLYSAQVQAIANAYADTAFSTSGPLTFCSGQSVTLSVPQDTLATYSWYHNNAPLNWSLHAFAASLSGTYKVTTKKNNCSRSTWPVQVNVLLKPVSGSIRHE